MKSKNLKVVLSIITLVLSVLSTSMGYGFMGETDIKFPVKFICGIVFMATPLLLVQLLILFWKKDK